jgi:hypothetical protein
VANFVRAFGNSGIWATTERIQWTPAEPLLPGRALAVAVAAQTADASRSLASYKEQGGDSTFRPSPFDEPLEDLLSEARVMRALVDAYQLASSPSELASLRRSLGKQRSHGGRPFEGSLVSPLRKAGLEVEFLPRRVAAGIGFRLVGGGAADMIMLRSSSGHPSVDAGGVALRPQSLMNLIALVAGPILRAAVVTITGVENERPAIGTGLAFTPAMLPTLYLQAMTAFGAGRAIYRCQWRGCKGAPGRAPLFLFRTRLTGEPDGDRWVWRKPRGTRQRKRAEMYCSQECANASSSASDRDRRRSARTCARPGCSTILRQTNKDSYCSIHGKG